MVAIRCYGFAFPDSLSCLRTYNCKAAWPKDAERVRNRGYHACSSLLPRRPPPVVLVVHGPLPEGKGRKTQGGAAWGAGGVALFRSLSAISL
jgi:hypothetical protein